MFLNLKVIFITISLDNQLIYYLFLPLIIHVFFFFQENNNSSDQVEIKEGELN